MKEKLLEAAEKISTIQGENSSNEISLFNISYKNICKLFFGLRYLRPTMTPQSSDTKNCIVLKVTLENKVRITVYCNPEDEKEVK